MISAMLALGFVPNDLIQWPLLLSLVSLKVILIHLWQLFYVITLLLIIIIVIDTTLDLNSLLIQLQPQVTQKWKEFTNVVGLSNNIMLTFEVQCRGVYCGGL